MRSRKRVAPLLLAVGAVLAALLVGVTPARATGAVSMWSPLGPTARSDGAMAYDPLLQKLVLFGGLNSNGGVLADTWTGNGTTWTQDAPAMSPSARSDFGMAYDPALGEVVLFGGLTGASQSTAVNDTWAYNGTTWTALSPTTPPPARSFASVAFDPSLGAAGELVLFGGLSTSGAALADTYAFDGTAWTALSPSQSPSARSDMSMSYDTAAHQLVLFGGLSGATALADTWTFNGTTWAAASPAASPPARSDAAMDYDAATSELVLFGGASGTTSLSDTWTYNGTTWTRVSTATSPSARNTAALAYDAATSELVLFGGTDANSDTLGDTWLSNGTTWVAATPPARSDYAMADDPAVGQAVLYGGLAADGITALADTWVYDGTSWVQKVPSASPPARSFASMAYDQASGQLVLFGGIDSSGNALDDTWVYNGTTWTQLSTPVSPAAPCTPSPPTLGCGRSDASLNYDASLGELVLFGGFDWSGNPLGDTWTFNGTTWTPMGPSARSDYGSAYDSATNQLVVFGGLDVNGYTLGDTWVESGSTWHQVGGTQPPARSNGAMAYDAALAEVILYGGLDVNGNNTLSDTWAFNGAGWTKLAPAVSPGLRSDASLTYDSSLGKLVLFGGITEASINPVQQDTWTFEATGFATYTWQKLSLGANAKPSARSDATMTYNAATNQVVLFGGTDVNFNPLSDTWAFNGSSWSQVSPPPATAPPARSLAAMAYDPTTSQVVLFGGQGAGGTTLSDEWTYSSSGWSAQTTATLPSARSDMSMVFDTTSNQLLLFGGLDPLANTLSDAWSSSGTSWVALTPSARSDAAMAYDAATSQVVLFGGLAADGFTALADTWTFTGTTWAQVPTTSAPSARDLASMAYDPTSGSVVLFGGIASDGVTTLGDEWTFASGAWTAQTPSVLPLARSDAVMIEDSAAGQLLLFGGLDSTGSPLGDTWVTISIVPGSPTNLAAVPGIGQATLSWTAPAPGESPITSYKVAITDTTSSTTLPAVTVTGSPPVTSAPITGLTPGHSYSFTVSATNAEGTGPVSEPLDELMPAPYFPVTPARICDTRSNGNSTPCAGKTLGAGGTLNVQVTGHGTVPAGATAVVANVTVTGATAPSFLTAYPEGTTRPLASNLNFVTGQTVPNLVTVPLSSSGGLELFNESGSVDAIVDVDGYYGPGSGQGFTSLTPARICDTRSNGNSTPCAAKTLGAGGTLTVQVAGHGGVPSGAAAVVANVTATGPTAASYLTAYPDGTTRPLASNLNFAAGQTVPNRVVIPLSSAGALDLYNGFGSVDAIVDVDGYYSSSTTGYFAPVAPARICDTRSSNSTQCAGKTPGGASTLNVQVSGNGGVPSGAAAVVANVTATGPTAAGYLTVYPAGASLPLASDLNFTAGQTVPNLVVAKLSSSGAVGVYNAFGSTNVIVDVGGWFTP